MKTAMQELIKKLKDTQKYIIAKNEYSTGYDGALSDCINVAESLLEKEKQQIIDALNSQKQKGKDYYNQTYDKL